MPAPADHHTPGRGGRGSQTFSPVARGPDPAAAGRAGRGKRSVVEAEPAQLLRIPLPVLSDLDAQVEVHPGAQQRLDLVPGAGPYLLQPRPLRADDDRL